MNLIVTMLPVIFSLRAIESPLRFAPPIIAGGTSRASYGRLGRSTWIFALVSLMGASSATTPAQAQYRYFQGVAPGFRPDLSSPVQPTGYWDVASLAPAPTQASPAPAEAIPTAPAASYSPVTSNPTAAPLRMPATGILPGTGSFFPTARSTVKPFVQVQPRPNAFVTYGALMSTDGPNIGWYDDVNMNWYDEFGFD